MGCGVNFSEAECQLLVVSGQTVQHVNALGYLGSLLSLDARIGPEVDRRLAGAPRAFSAMQCVFTDNNLSVKTKQMLYKCLYCDCSALWSKELAHTEEG